MNDVRYLSVYDGGDSLSLSSEHTDYTVTV